MEWEPSQLYHENSRNESATKHVLASYRLHYDRDVIELQKRSTKKVEGHVTVRLRNHEIDWPSLDKVLETRFSKRDFDQDSVLSLDDLGRILINSYGVIPDQSAAYIYKRRIANSGNLGSPEIYVLVRNVESLVRGIYHFNSATFDLTTISHGDFTTWLVNHVLFQIEFANASALLFITSNVSRLKKKYGERGYRLALIDAGHLSQNIYLVSTALQIGVCATGGFVDREVDLALGIDGLDEATMLALAIGR